ncbi:MAG TPA: AraC family transcriptional regulator [Hydrogenophaga sp.]
MSTPAKPRLDRLSGLLDRFPVRAELSFTGALCGVQSFVPAPGTGYLHVLRRGSLKVTHPPRQGVPPALHLAAPSLLFYPRAITHHFHNPPLEGSDFTCAQLRFDGGPAHPLVRTMPGVIVLPLQQVDGLQATLDLLFAETDQVRCGHRLLADRLFEVLLIQMLRWLLDHPQQAGIPPGLVTGLSDPRLARAIVAMHDAPGDAWRVEQLAQVAGMSRTGFANQFRQMVGQTPADYLSQWRIGLAQAGLLQGASIKQLATELGYANASALSRAFLGKTGQAPRDWLSTEAGRSAK